MSAAAIRLVLFALAACLAGAPGPALASYVEIPAGLPGVSGGDLAWGDVDGDGDLDLALAGYTPGAAICRVYRNDGLAFTDLGAGLPGFTSVRLAWADHDADGDLDLVVCGLDTGGQPATIVYRNDGMGGFTAEPFDLPGHHGGLVAWGDWDRDGDLDLVATGLDGGAQGRGCIHRNEGAAGYTTVTDDVVELNQGDGGWLDHDGDGDLDLLVVGASTQGEVSAFYRNDGQGLFTFQDVGLSPLTGAAAAWADMDGDGDQDLLLCGEIGSTRVTRLYRNDGDASFTELPVGLPGLQGGDVAWGDHDNDGDLDLLLVGTTTLEGAIARVWRNDGAGVFTALDVGLPGMSEARVAWADCDGDGDLDVAVAGFDAGGAITRVFLNEGAAANAPPAAPGGLAATVTGNRVTFTWAAAGDDHTPAAQLGYNLRVGSTPGAGDVCPPMADPATGRRLRPGPGNVTGGLSHQLDLAPGVYYWSVQALDGAGQGSAFATGQFVSWAPPVTPFTMADVGLDDAPDMLADWGDLEADGDLDLVLAGTASGFFVTRVFVNGGDGFTDLDSTFAGVRDGAVLWADHDGDGDLDILEAGSDMRIHRNDSPGFTSFVPPGVDVAANAAVVWEDLDNDGDRDLVMCGERETEGRITLVYSNDGDGSYTRLFSVLPSMSNGDIAAGDLDGDGDRDLVMMGEISGHYPRTRAFRNDGDWEFQEVVIGPLAGRFAAVELADLDADGDLDLVLAGSPGVVEPPFTRVLRNDTGFGFTDLQAGITGQRGGDLAAADIDADGDLDLAVSGWDEDLGPTVRVWRNDGGGLFTDLESGLPGSSGELAWGDWDRDHDLDLLHGDGHRLALNGGTATNTAPTAPTGLTATVTDGRVTFAWQPATDVETPDTGLSYNLRAGTAPGGHDLLAAEALADGTRLVARRGNVEQGTAWTLTLPDDVAQIFWSVQAVDGALAGGPFAPEAVVDVATAAPAAAATPDVLVLAGCRPNPFNPTTAVTFSLDRADVVRLEAYDLRGRRVSTAPLGARAAGRHVVAWQARDDRGQPLSSGVYVLRLRGTTGVSGGLKVTLAR